MAKDYQPKSKQRDVLLGMAQAGNSMAKLPLLINNNYAKDMEEDYSGITNPFRSDYDSLENSLKRLKKIQSKHQR